MATQRQIRKQKNLPKEKTVNKNICVDTIQRLTKEIAHEKEWTSLKKRETTRKKFT